MRTLLLLRHGKAVASEPDGDHARGLTERGRAQAKGVAELLGRLGLQPQLALVSDARRTRETAELAVGHGDTGVVLEPALYAASVAEVLDAIRGQGADYRCVMVVGHNPGIGDAARALAGTGEPQARIGLGESFPTGTLAVLEFDGGHWSELTSGSGFLSRFIVPERG